MSTRMKKDQKEKIRQFIACTQTNEAIALTCLTNSNWSLEMAVDIFYQNPSYFSQINSGGVDMKAMQQFFLRYANDPEDKMANRIGPHGMLRLLNDAGVDPSDRKVLILAWKLKAATQCEFSAEEFRDGMRDLKVDSPEKLRAKMDNLPEEIKSSDSFREFYHFTFQYAKSVSQRSLDLETAIAYWQLIFNNADPRVNLWIRFLSERNVKGIPRDTWNLFLDFIFHTDIADPTFANYDADGAWPVLIDEFVDYAKSSANVKQ